MTSNGKEKKVIACVIYPGTPPLDIVGSWQFFGPLVTKGYELVVVAERLEPVPTDTPLKIVPDKTFDNVPRPHGLMVMGGGPAGHGVGDERLVDYVRQAGQTAELVVSIGTGSLILAAAGLLAGRRATTHWMHATALEAAGVTYTRRRWVEDGKFLTAAGDTAGIDMAVHLVARLVGERAARIRQLWTEYDPQPPLGGIDWSAAAAFAPGPRPAPLAAGDKKPIAFVLYPGLTVFDLVGPLQVLSRLADFAPEYKTVVVAERLEPVASDTGLTFLPSSTFDTLPQPYGLMVPGGGIPTLRAMSNPVLRHYIHSANAHSTFTGSVCTGALLLASVGLLAGRRVPTHWAFDDVLEQYGAHYVRKRWVEDGKFVISAGVSAGIDSALAIAARLTDEEMARRVQLSLEYDPQPPLGPIDYDQLDANSRLIKTALSLAAPLLTMKAKRMLRREQRPATP